MNCKNCGTQLTGAEHACPVCGAPVPQVQQPVGMPQQPVEQVVMPQQAPQMTAVPPTEAMAAVPGTQPTAGEKAPKNSKKTIGLVLIVIAIIIIGIGVFLSLTGESSESKANNNNTPSETYDYDDAEPTAITQSYAGYTFTLPDGYTAEVMEDYGLKISNGVTIYTIAVDYSHTYDQYKQAYEKANMELTVSNVIEREFASADLIDANDPTAHEAEYISSATETSSFVGMIVKSDYTAPTTTEYAELTGILDGAIQDYEVEAGTDEDAGKASYKVYTFDRANFVF